MSQNLPNMLQDTISKIREMMSVNDVVGEPIVVGDVTIIPISKVSVGFGGGGADNAKAANKDAFGGGMGCGNLCGALAGSMAALGKVFLAEDEMYKPEFKDVCAGFVAKFNEKWGTTLCAPIKEVNATDPRTRCSLTVLETGNMLQEYIDNLMKK